MNNEATEAENIGSVATTTGTGSSGSRPTAPSQGQGPGPGVHPTRHGSMMHHHSGANGTKQTPSVTVTPKMVFDKPAPASTAAADEENKAKMAASTPRRVSAPKPTPKVKPARVNALSDRPCQHHSFLTDITDVRQMEQGLLQLLDDFHSGKLQAFGKGCSFEQMDSVREQQEKLARLHFDLGAQQENYNPLSDEGRAVAKENMTKLMENLQQLSLSIEQLHSCTSNLGLQTDV